MVLDENRTNLSENVAVLSQWPISEILQKSAERDIEKFRPTDEERHRTAAHMRTVPFFQRSNVTEQY